MFKKKKEGFTLVELLIVLAVIAALLAIVTPVAVNAVARAKATQVASTLRNIAAAAQQYYYTEGDSATTLSVSVLKKKNYITGNIKGFDIVDTNGSSPITIDNSASQLIFWVVYTPSIDAIKVNDVWKDATDNGIPTGSVGVQATVTRYW